MKSGLLLNKVDSIDFAHKEKQYENKAKELRLSKMVEREKVKPSFYRVNEKVQVGGNGLCLENEYIYIYESEAS